MISSQEKILCKHVVLQMFYVVVNLHFVVHTLPSKLRSDLPKGDNRMQFPFNQEEKYCAIVPVIQVMIFEQILSQSNPRGYTSCAKTFSLLSCRMCDFLDFVYAAEKRKGITCLTLQLLCDVSLYLVSYLVIVVIQWYGSSTAIWYNQRV